MASNSEPVSIRLLERDDMAWLLRVNNAAVPAVNPHDASSLRALVEGAERCWVATVGKMRAGVLVVYGPGASYESANYRWLSERYERFRYVDRVIVVPEAKGRGVGRGLYEALEAHAASAEAQRVLCEVNIDPPNPASLAFHAAMGWAPLADRQLGPGKSVRYFEKRMS
ncbi:MAG: GNAT family N-acetyltransferase [Nannocystaceae bacterium]|nr:GNAT family N-acetyltransferase [bacterium]